MDLMHNSVYKIIEGSETGIYRVVLNLLKIGKLAVVRLDSSDGPMVKKGGRKKIANNKSPRKKAVPPFVGKLIWVNHTDLQRLHDLSSLIILDSIEPEFIHLSSTSITTFEHRKKAMRPFLEFEHLRENIVLNNGIGGLVKEVMQVSGVSKFFVYKMFSLLCKYGFLESSLNPAHHRCGAPGKLRPCDPGGRMKPGAKTTKQLISKTYGENLLPEQPGVSSEWRNRIMAADKKIPTPKPKMPERCKIIIDSAFIRGYQYKNGILDTVNLKQGEYPNNRQIRRVLENEIPRLQRILEKTTLGHFKRSLRGLTGKNWKGVSGPGHTWAIDSTIADIYLRSSLNRSWIIGRPIVYIIVDVWSTAIVGFYVCLTGPSWNTAKVSLFSSAAPPELIAELWGYQPIFSLYPAPTMCAVLMCDRGEYLSLAACLTGMKLIPCLSYAPPYRPDMKGLVEVLHRIEKDRQYYFTPGAIDQRRKEFDLRKFNPNDAVLTVSEYTNYLHTIFSEYNLTANRENRLDAHMKAADVYPSPAGLWRWGHEIGMGVRRSIPISELITNLLPSGEATVTRHGVIYSGKEYSSKFVDDQQWTAHARNLGVWNIPINYYPGTVSRIWTPNFGSQGVLDLTISDQSIASPELTFDEVADATMYSKINKGSIDHINMLAALQSLNRKKEIIANAKILTEEAIARDNGPSPNITESRNIETSFHQSNTTIPLRVADPDPDIASKNHHSMMQAILASADIEELKHV
jgi:hypothetical protein